MNPDHGGQIFDQIFVVFLKKKMQKTSQNHDLVRLLQSKLGYQALNVTFKARLSNKHSS